MGEGENPGQREQVLDECFLLALDLLADHRLPVVASHIVEFHPVPVSVVEDCQAAFSSIWLWTSSPGERPWVLPSCDWLSLATWPAETPRIPAHLTPRPEVRRPVCGKQPQEVLRLLLVVQTDQLHALRLAEPHPTRPVKVVSAHPPGEQVALSLELVVALSLGSAWCRRQSFWGSCCWWRCWGGDRCVGDSWEGGHPG